MKKVCMTLGCRPSVFFAGGFMKNKNRDSQVDDVNTIWKLKHTPLKERKTSSGITFWPEKVKKNETKQFC